MSFFDKINELFPELLSEMTTQGSQQDSTQILEAEINEIEGCDISSGTELGVRMTTFPCLQQTIYTSLSLHQRPQTTPMVRIVLISNYWTIT